MKALVAKAPPPARARDARKFRSRSAGRIKRVVLQSRRGPAWALRARAGAEAHAADLPSPPRDPLHPNRTEASHGQDLPDQPALPDLVLGPEPRPAAPGQEGEHAGPGTAGPGRPDPAGARGRPDRREYRGTRLRRARGVGNRRPERQDGPARADGPDTPG